MELKKIIDGKTMRVIFSGDLVYPEAMEMNTIIEDIEDNDIKELIFDFSNVTFLDSAGFGGVLNAYRAVLDSGASFSIINPSQDTKDLLMSNKISSMLNIVDEG